MTRFPARFAGPENWRYQSISSAKAQTFAFGRVHIWDRGQHVERQVVSRLRRELEFQNAIGSSVCEGTEIVSIAVGQKQHGSRSRSRRPGRGESRRHWNALGAVAWMARLFCWNIKRGQKRLDVVSGELLEALWGSDLDQGDVGEDLDTILPCLSKGSLAGTQSNVDVPDRPHRNCRPLSASPLVESVRMWSSQNLLSPPGRRH